MAEAPGSFGVFDYQRIQSPLVFPKLPGISSKTLNAKLTLTMDTGTLASTLL